MQPTAVLLAAAGLAAATTIPVSVGRNGLTFEPNVIRAHEGDVIEFRFWPRNHSVVAGDFTEACRPADDNGFFSGFFPTQPGTVNAEVFRVTVSHTNPVPVYCSQNTGQHCRNGMVAVINPAGVGRLTLDAYAALARAAPGNATSPPGGAFGGVVAPNPNPGAGDTSDGSSGAASATSSGGGGGSSGSSAAAATSSTAVGSETQTQTETTADSETTAGTTTATATTTTGGDDATVTTATTDAPTGTETGNVAAGVAVPVAGLVAVAMAAFFV